MGGGFNYNGGYSGGSGYGGSYGGGYSYGASNNPLAFVLFWGDLFYTSKSERERFNVHVKSSPSVYTFKSTVRLKSVSGSGTSTVYAGGGKRQGGSKGSFPLPYKYPQSGAINTTTFAEPFFMAAESGISSFLELVGVGINASHFIASATLFVGPLVMGRPRVGNIKMGWRVGEPITNITTKGNIPKWSTVRQRYWKNEALVNSNAYDVSNLPRMQRGLAPQRINPNTGLMESMELHHHVLPQREGGLFDFIKLWPDEHKAVDPFRR